MALIRAEYPLQRNEKKEGREFVSSEKERERLKRRPTRVRLFRDRNFFETKTYWDKRKRRGDDRGGGGVIRE